MRIYNPEKEKNHKQKKRLCIWLEFIPFFGLYWCIRWLPLKYAYKLSNLLCRLLFVIDIKHRKRSIKHVMHAGIAASQNHAKAIARNSFQSFGKLLAEIIKLDQLFSSDMIHLAGSKSTRAEVYDAGQKNQNVIIVTAHYGNWELAGSTWATNTGIPMVSVMREFNNPLIGRYILRNRRSDAHEVIPKKGGMRGLLRAIKEGKNVAILADQHAGRNEGVETVFFGQPCRTHSSPAILHLKTGVPIMPEITRRMDDHLNFEFILGDLIKYQPTGDKEKDIRTVTQLYTTALETMISQHPEQWLWAHRRWLNIHRKKRSNRVVDNALGIG